jgi:hypothetical protein
MIVQLIRNSCLISARKFTQQGFASDGSDVLGDVYIAVSKWVKSKPQGTIHAGGIALVASREAIRAYQRELSNRLI